MSLADRPRYTEIHPSDTYSLPQSATYISGRSEEERGQHVVALAARCPGAEFVDVDESSPGQLVVTRGGDSTEIPLRSSAALTDFWEQLGPAPSYLDITGLTHSAWAPLLRGALIAGVDLRVVYVEPIRYRFNTIRTEGELFDLSVNFGGIGPLPGFLSLAEPVEEEVVFVPLLGFEGPRFSMVLNHAQVPRERIYPVVGVPGFQPEFVFYAYQGNRLPLEETGSWMAIQYATANCPFSVFYTLEQISSDTGGDFMRVAPVGTKPHGLGAVLFALAHPDRVELIYDHPVRREGRTSGVARLLIYHVAALRDRLQL